METERPIEIGTRRELFVDDLLIAETRGGAARRLHPPMPREIAIEHDRPWEGNVSGYHTVFRDGGLYRMYYRGWNADPATHKPTHPSVTCYAESRDGIRWSKPALGLVAYEGSKDNNIVWDGAGSHNFCPFVDANPACPPQARYKAVGSRGAGLFAFVSPDGIRWSMLRDEPVITDGKFDSQNLAFFDTVRGEYRAYYRDFRDKVRDIKTATSPDFVTWTPGEWLSYPGAPTEQLYTNQIGPCPRAPHIFIGFPTRFMGGRESITEGVLMSSRDGRAFQRWGEALIRPGANPARWWNRSNYIWLGLPETASDVPGAPDELSLYSIEGYYQGASNRVRRFTSRQDGFVSLNAPLAGGEVVTRPLIFAGGRLELNLSTSAAGSVRVELLDAEWRAVPGYGLDDCGELFGDSLDRAVSWGARGDTAPLAGRPIRLRFVIHDADVFSFRFAPAV